MAIEHQRSANVPPGLASIRALLVDRDDDTREMYAEYLRLASCDVDQATDGRQALAIAVSRRPHIVITETQLPGIDGFDLCRLLRADRTTGETPIIVVTGDAYERDIERARAAGATEVLVKPCLPEDLAARIRQVLQASRDSIDRGEKAYAKAAATSIARARLREARLKHQQTLVRSHNRRQTDSPPVPAPQLACPQCDAELVYDHSYVGGVNAHHTEQWDYFRCPGGCGTYQYRQRTRKLRKTG
jgi:two-component system cell cycle response regulator DivK